MKRIGFALLALIPALMLGLVLAAGALAVPPRDGSGTKDPGQAESHRRQGTAARRAAGRRTARRRRPPHRRPQGRPRPHDPRGVRRHGQDRRHHLHRPASQPDPEARAERQRQLLDPRLQRRPLPEHAVRHEGRRPHDVHVLPAAVGQVLHGRRSGVRLGQGPALRGLLRSRRRRPRARAGAQRRADPRQHGPLGRLRRGRRRRRRPRAVRARRRRGGGQLDDLGALLHRGPAGADQRPRRRRGSVHHQPRGRHHRRVLPRVRPQPGAARHLRHHLQRPGQHRVLGAHELRLLGGRQR